ncbi:hypothetical protein SUGI_0128150 [Cryptomeria japonica]|nr:hypothetical protein SUGI_0128150 [Cryptomeria japonica]
MGKAKQWEVMDLRVFEAAHLGNINAIQDLIDEIADVLEQVTSSSQNSVLHVAARAGQAEFVSEILRIKPEILFYVNSKLDTVLQEAAREGHSAVVEGVVGRICYMLDGSDRSVLHIAAMKGQFSVVHEILSCRPDSTDMLSTIGETFVDSAVEANQIEIVKHVGDLLHTSKLIRTQDNKGNIVLHVATRKKLKQVSEQNDPQLGSPPVHRDFCFICTQNHLSSDCF